MEVANGVTVQERPAGEPRETRYRCWNPVLCRVPGGSLLLFYEVGPSPSESWGMVRTSPDGGITWSAARRLPPVLEDQPGEYSCPGTIQASDGLVLVSDTYLRRTVKHVTLTPEELASRG